jgi:hypothetical protein
MSADKTPFYQIVKSLQIGFEVSFRQPDSGSIVITVTSPKHRLERVEQIDLESAQMAAVDVNEIFALGIERCREDLKKEIAR